MVWFQCEDCGENLKKPKLPGHFRMCSAYKLSCIDCGEVFNQQSVQSHTQCITEAEKYGPKGQGKASNSAQAKPDKPKPNSEVDINVGLSSRAPWLCSLCNTSATSKQTLLLHADGKKHRAKARAFHAAQKQSNQTEESTPNEVKNADNGPKVESVEVNGSKNDVQERDLVKDAAAPLKEEERKSQKKRKSGDDLSETKENISRDLSSGEVIQAEQSEGPKSKSKKKKCADELRQTEDQVDKQGVVKEATKDKIKWKKLVTSALKSSTDGVLKRKKLQKLIVKALKESGVTKDEEQLCEEFMNKISSTSRFTVDNKRIRLVKTEDA